MARRRARRARRLRKRWDELQQRRTGLGAPKVVQRRRTAPLVFSWSLANRSSGGAAGGAASEAAHGGAGGTARRGASGRVCIASICAGVAQLASKLASPWTCGAAAGAEAAAHVQVPPRGEVAPGAPAQVPLQRRGHERS